MKSRRSKNVYDKSTKKGETVDNKTNQKSHLPKVSKLSRKQIGLGISDYEFLKVKMMINLIQF